MNDKQQYQSETGEMGFQDDLPRIIGRCEFCEDDLWDDNDLWTDEEGNHFCSAECAMEYHGIHAIDDEK